MREPAVAGMFYPKQKEILKKLLQDFLKEARSSNPPQTNIAIAPHAGYVYSGSVAALSFAALEKELKKDNSTIIILGPNHTGLGSGAAVSFDEWKTPLGILKPNTSLAFRLVENCTLLKKDELAHFKEHSIEVMLPFVHIINPNAKIVPICLGLENIDFCFVIGQAIYQTINEPEFKKENIVVLASSDFSHYLDGETAKKLDLPAIEKIIKLDARAFAKEVILKDLSICGYQPIISTIEFAKLSSKKSAKLLKYTNSGAQTNSSEDQVVAYASIIFQ